MSDGQFFPIDRRQIFALGGTLGLFGAVPAAASPAAPSTGAGASFGDMIVLSDLGAKAMTFGDETAIVQKALDLAVQTRRPLLIDVATRVSELTIRGANGLVVIQTAPIVGLTSGNYPALLSIVDSSDISWMGRLWLSCQWNAGYGSAVHFLTRNSGITSNITVQDWSISGAKTAFRFGTPAPSGSAISEISIMGGFSYGCPNVVEAYGTETVVCFVGANLVANTLGGGKSWSAIPSDTVRVFGAHVSFTGGEIQHNASERGSAFLMQPYAGPDGPARFGAIIAVGAAIEAAGPMFTARNLPGATVDPESGHFFIEGCHGYHSQRTVPFIEIGGQYNGRVKVGSGCFFRAGAQRTEAIVRSSSEVRLDVPDDVFNARFHPIRATP